MPAAMPPTPAAQTPDVSAPESAAAAPASTAAAPAPEHASVPAKPATEATSTPLAAVAGGDFAVSFGSYASVADAERVIAALRGAGLPGYREAVTWGGKTVQRVRIGPFADRASAESARLRATRVRSDVDVRVVALNADTAPASASEPAAAPAAVAKTAATGVSGAATVTSGRDKPAADVAAEQVAKATSKTVGTKAPASAGSLATDTGKSKPATTAAAPEPAPARPANPSATGFVVQVGAFASASDAQALRDALRKAGFDAFTDTVPGASGPLTRVRVGPVVTRAEAEALKGRLQAIGKDGMVRPHP
jgi:cell division septation protein DedD